MAERRHGGRRGDARGGGRGGGRGDLPNEEAARQRDLRDIEIDDLRQQVRDLQRDIEIGELRQQVRDLQRREKRRRKSNPMRSNASEHRSVDDPLFNDVYGGQSKPVYDQDILSMPVYDEPIYDDDVFSIPDEPVYGEDIFSIPVYDKPVYEDDILSMPVYDKPVYDEDIFYELPVLMSKSSAPFVKFDNAAEDEGVVIHDDAEYDEAEGGNRLLGFMEPLYKNCTSLPCIKRDEVVRYGESKSADDNNKVCSVFLAVRNALEDQIEETPTRELCILTTLARSSPPALEEALRRIKVIRDLELSAVNDAKRHYPSSEESLKHLLWLSESEVVFEAALGLYDLNLAAIVALNLQKDPKEFLPLLQELERMPQLLMQYNIDLKLQRYESSLGHIVYVGDSYYEDCLNLRSKVQRFIR